MDNSREALLRGLETGFIDSTKSPESEYKPQLVLNNPPEQKVLTTIQRELKSCKSFDFSVAFITMGGLASLWNCLQDTADRGIPGRIITTDYLSFTEPQALKALEMFPNIEVGLYETSSSGRFHTKGYIFYKDEEKTCADVVIGSANITQAALSITREWNVQLSALSTGDLLKNIQKEFEEAWQYSTRYTPDLYVHYLEMYNLLHDKNSTYIPITEFENYSHKVEKEKIEPNSMQKEALVSLADIRAKGEKKALIISATGTGKTYLCAFDVRAVSPKKCLFIVHRENILRKARESFIDIMGGPSSLYGIFGANEKTKDSKYVFAMIQTLAKPQNLNQFAQEEFDYIVIDEAHHIQSEENTSYQRILQYFKPRFLLGLTATPERTDSYNIYKDFDNNVAFEIRLNQALEMNLLTPFHYYGVADMTVDGKPVGEDTSINDLVAEERLKLIDEKLKFYSMGRSNIKGLIFCSKVKEAYNLSEKLNEIGYKTKALCGTNTEEERKEAIERLEKDDNCSDSINYILTVDIFNEGIDIPSVNMVVMLRPTESVIVYIQQLGRGLRLCNGKDFLTVVDFIGNYKNNFMVPVALFGDRSYRRGTIEKLMIEGTPLIKGVSTIDFDRISKERIYSSINASKYSDRKILKEEYQNVKNRIGHIPSMMDFVNSNSISPLVFIGKYKSYNNFLKKYDNEYFWNPSIKESASLEFFSSVVANGLRPYEELIIRNLIKNGKTTVESIERQTKEMYGFEPLRDSILSAVRLLSDEFFDKAFRKTYLNIKYCAIHNDIVSSTVEFNNLLTGEEYKRQLLDILNVAQSEYRTHYLNNRRLNDLALYEKYTRQDVCRLLNWKTDEHGTINGYKVDPITRTCPIFVTYNKDSENISATTDYSDHFLNPMVFLWQTRTGKNKITKEVEQIAGKSDLGIIKLPLFITKDKKVKNNQSSNSEYNFSIVDNGATYHYYMGDVTFRKATETTRAGKKIYDVEFIMNEPVKPEMYEYFEALKQLKVECSSLVS